jgi:hypothetical protein
VRPEVRGKKDGNAAGFLHGEASMREHIGGLRKSTKQLRI